MKPKKEYNYTLWALHILIAIPLFFLFAKVFTQGYVLEGMIDRREITLPFHYLNLRAFHAGEYPQWCAYLFSGVPIPHIAMDYAWNPLNWPLYFWGQEKDIPYYITFLQIIKHIITGIAAYLFFRKVFTATAGVILATCIYAWSSSAVWMTITTELTTGLFLPLGLLLLLESRKGLSPRALVIFAIILAIDISGGVLQWTYFLWLIWLSYAIYLSFGSKKIRIRKIEVPVPLCLLFFSSALALLLSAPKILPFVGAMVSGEITRSSPYATLMECVNAFHTPLITLIRLVAPNILGYLTPVNILFAPQPHQNYVETMLAGVGFIAVTMGLYGIVFGRTYRRHPYPFLMIALLLLILIFKPVSYLWMLLAGKGMIYSRWAVYLPIFLAWAAAAGFEWLISCNMRPFQNRRFWRIWTYSILFVAGLILPKAIKENGSFYLYNYARSALLLAGMILILAICIALWQKKIISLKALKIAIIFTCLTELICNAAIEVYTYHKFLVPGNGYYATDNSLRQVIKEYEKNKDFTIKKFIYPLFYNPFPTSNSNIVYRLTQVSGFTNTMPKKYVECINALAGSPQLFRHVELPPKLYGVFGVAYERIGGTIDNCFELVKSGIDMPSRTKLANRLEIVGSEKETVSRMKNIPDLSGSVVLEKKEFLRLCKNEKIFWDIFSKKNSLAKVPKGEISWLEEKPNSFTIRVKADQACFLSLWRGYYNGMEGTVDGKMITVLKANNAFMALPILPGEHTIVMRYKNPFLPWAFGLAIAGGLICCILLFFSKKRPIN